MIDGHGDDRHLYPNVQINFSSNIFSHADLSGLKRHLAARLDCIGSYPEPEPYTLEALIAKQLGIGADCVMVTNGATEAIYLIAQTFRDHCAVVQEPTFAEYASACKEGQDDGPKLHFICNPNNPTGRVSPITFAPDALYAIDQAYEDYTLCPLLKDSDTVRMPNVMLLHSMTKRYCIPGLRLGYVTANDRIISRLREQRQPWSVNALAIEAGKYLLRHGIPNFPDLHAYLMETERLRTMLNSIEGIQMKPTDTNFMLGTISHCTTHELKTYLAEEQGILIRDAANFKGLTTHHFRIATQLPHENDRLVEAIRQRINSI